MKFCKPFAKSISYCLHRLKLSLHLWKYNDKNMTTDKKPLLWVLNDENVRI